MKKHSDYEANYNEDNEIFKQAAYSRSKEKYHFKRKIEEYEERRHLKHLLHELYEDIDDIDWSNISSESSDNQYPL